MKLASLRYQGEEKAGILVPGGILPLELLNRKFGWKVPNDLLGLIETGSLETISGWVQAGGEKRPSGPKGSSSSRERRFPSPPCTAAPARSGASG